MKKYMGILLECIYLVLSYKLNLSFEYCNGFELLLGTIVTDIIINMIEWFIYLTAFSCTKIFIPLIGHDSSIMKIIHWSIRIMLCFLVFVITLTPLSNLAITSLIQILTNQFTNYFQLKITELSDAILSSLPLYSH